MPRGKGFNDFRIDGDVVFLQITDIHGLPKCEAMIDLADLPRLQALGHRWNANTVNENKTYIVRSVKGVDRYLHRFIMGAGDGQLVDHRDGNCLDNRRSNLRLATAADNARNRAMGKNNTSGYKGVTWDQSRQKWVAFIHHLGKMKFLGRHLCPIKAAKAYDAAATRLFGEFAQLNFPAAPATAHD